MSERTLLNMAKISSKKAIKGFDIGKETSRNPDSIRQGFPDVVDARFDNINSNYESVSKFKNTKASTIFKTVSARKELWGEPQP